MCSPSNYYICFHIQRPNLFVNHLRQIMYSPDIVQFEYHLLVLSFVIVLLIYLVLLLKKKDYFLLNIYSAYNSSFLNKELIFYLYHLSIAPNFVIVRTFYFLLLIISYKFSISFQVILLNIIYVLDEDSWQYYFNYYALPLVVRFLLY